MFLKSYIPIFCFLNFIQFFFSAASDARVNPSPALNSNTGNLAAFSGGGYASTADISFTDSNPAGLAVLDRQYIFTSATTFHSQGFQLYEVGNFDSVNTDIAGALRLRQTNLSTGSIDRRLTLGLAYKLEWLGNFALGLSGDYSQIDVRQNWRGVGDNFNGRVGLFYGFKLLDIPVNFGVAGGGLFDKYVAKNLGIGLSTVGLRGFYIFNVDMLMNSLDGINQLMSGVTIFAQQYLDIKASYGYNLKNKKSFGAGGFFLKSEIIRMYYVLMRENSPDKYIKHSFGLDILIAL
ncbi:MAG: hypothetical protein K2X39_07795 [Silvanigrellaceae bacterium]|nr:hypothetical protein [Silvanigrellaceae bacterium]